MKIQLNLNFICLSILLILVSCKQNNVETAFDDLPDPSPNMVENPGFESQFENTWQVSGFKRGEGKGVVVKGIFRGGNKSLQLSKTNSYGYLQLSTLEPITVEPGETYTFRFWFNSFNASITSFMIPRLVTNNNAVNITNTKSALWVNYDYDSQSLMRNAQSTRPEDWIKRVVFYENDTEEPQEIYLQVMLYGNPFDVYIDDVTFFKGKKPGINTPDNPEFKYTKEEVLKILADRDEEEAYFSFKNHTMHFNVNGKETWPRLYRAAPRRDKYGQQDPAGFYEHGVEINNVMVMRNYWIGKDTYDWDQLEKALLQTLRKNPYAKLHLDFSMDPYREWLDENPGSNWETKDGKKLNEASYASQKWREDGSKAIRALIKDMKEHGYWKAVVGAVVWGGHDGQFWTKVIGEFASDYSPEHVDAWHDYLLNEYIDISKLNETWNASYDDFNEVPIPETPMSHENIPVILPKSILTDYRQFTEATAFELRELFASVIKAEAGKRMYVMSYGMPMENQHERFLKMAGENGKANDVITSMSYYPYRQPGFASGYHPEQSFAYYHTAFCQELDLRTWASDQGWYDELSNMWVGSMPNLKDFRNMHRKLVGISLAQDQAYWYYDMDKQYVNEEVLDEIGKVSQIADKLVNKKGVDFRPDVCLIRFGAESRYYGTSVDNAVGATNYWQYMLLETSGVPYDIHYLMDIMSFPELQDYKIYIFHNNTFLSQEERDWINNNLKKDGRTIVWMYDTGYVTENGISVRDQSELVGMDIGTEKGYQRAEVQITKTDPLNGKGKDYFDVPEFQGMAEAMASIFTWEGSASIGKHHISKWDYVVFPGVSRYQKFWVEGGYDAALGVYREDDKAALAVKRFPNWTSIYVGAPNSIASEMMNNIAREANAYRCGPPSMGELRMSGRFVSYHALKTGPYIFKLPTGASKIIDATNGKLLKENISEYTIDGIAQNTYWFFVE